MNKPNPPVISGVLRLHIEGVEELDGDIRLGAFIEKLSALKAALGETEHMVFRGRGRCVDFRVSELSHSSPAMIGLTPFSDNCDVQPWDVVNAFTTFIDQVRHRRAAAVSGNAKVVKQLRRLLHGVGEKFDRLWIDGTNIPTITLDAEMARALDDALPDVRHEVGTVTGRVKMYSGVGKQPYFRIFPPMDGVEIKCVFSPDMLGRAALAVERNATVEGELKYYEGDLWPHEVKVQEIRVLPRDEALPSLSSLAGAAPKATGELSAGEFVRQLRLSWRDEQGGDTE